MTLNDHMEFGHVVYSDGRGNVESRNCTPSGPVWAPEPYVDLDENGQMISLDPNEVHGLDDWTLLDGFSGQYRYSGPIMHSSEFVGGALEKHIRNTPGYYAAVIVRGIGPDPDDIEDDIVGWAVAHWEEP